MEYNELEKIGILDFIKPHEDKNELLEIKNCKKIHKVQCANLKAQENKKKTKDFTFDFIKEKFFYIYITVELNVNYCKLLPINERKFFNTGSNNKDSPSYLDFDYNKYNIFLNICHEEESEIKLYNRIELNRESTVVSHTTIDSLDYYKETSNVIGKHETTMEFEKFSTLLDEYLMIELETKKSERDVSLKEDGVSNVLFLLTKEESNMIELYTFIKYAVFYVKASLSNYISKYIYDIIHDYTHLPNENLLKFLENFGIVTFKNDNQKTMFPLKKYVKLFRILQNENKINYLNRQLPNIKNQRNIDNVAFYKFIRLLNRYDLFQAEKDLRIKQSDFKNKEKYCFLKSSCIVESNDQILGEHKINLQKVLTDFMIKINESLIVYADIHQPEMIDKFFMNNLIKYILQYTCYKGFFNIDIVINEDSMIDLHCCKEKKKNTRFNKFAYKCLSQCMNCLNLFFDANEGFFHKHFNVLNFAYNFNEKNVIHTFPSYFDSSKKNNIRIFDIPFEEKWACLIVSLILQIWKDKHCLLAFTNYNTDLVEDENFKEKSRNKFFHFFEEIVDIITKEFFDQYEEGLPDFLLFCNKISKHPLNKYNCIDNICQHFTNSSIQILLQNNIIFYQPFDLIFNTDTDYMKNAGVYSQPIFNKIIEPYLIFIDEELNDYINAKEKKEMFLNKKNITLESYTKQVKMINSEKINYNLILGKEKNIDFIGNNKISIGTSDEEDCKKWESQTCFSSIENCTYNFSFLLNLNYYFIYKETMQMKDQMISYCILKRYIYSLETSQSLSFEGYDHSMLKNISKNLNQVKNICKHSKAILLKHIRNMRKVKSINENMLYVFYTYMKNAIKNVKEKHKIMEESKNTFIKIGYYFINLKTIDVENTLDKFIESQYYNNFINY